MRTRRHHSFGWHALRLACVLFAASVAGCASTPDVTDREARVEAARAAFGKPFTFFYIPSDGAIEDAAFIALSKTTGPSGMSKELSGLMSAAEQNQMRIVVTGPSREKTEHVLLEALELIRGKRLAKLEVLFLGNSTYRDKFHEVVSSVGAAFRFAPY